MRLLPLTLLSLLLSAPVAGAAELTVNLKGIEDAAHQVRLQLYRGQEGFRKPQAAVRRVEQAADPEGVTVRFSDLAPGRYAVIAYHDQDGDGEMDRFLGMVPTEGYGLSQNPEVTGPPAFADSAFDVGEMGQAITVHMRY